jgi:Txe/YoeB family toxin of Txe-Axe toxin-antitoxin module
MGVKTNMGALTSMLQFKPSDEKLRGEREGQRASRLNIQYRVIYSVEEAVVTVRVLEITPHEY